MSDPQRTPRARIAQLTLDVHDVQRLAQFWSQALGYQVDSGDGDVHLYAPADDVDGEPPVTIWLQPTPADKAGKNRCHPDLVAPGDPAAEVERLIALGATRADVGQTGDEGFTVLADPEGNEFCVLDGDSRDRSRR